MKNVYDVIKRPLLTEKSTALRSSENQVVFAVAKEANKYEIKSAIENIFKVEVAAVNTMIYRGKDKRVGRTFGRRSNWKKAVVTMAAGTNLDVFGGVAQDGAETTQQD